MNGYQSFIESPPFCWREHDNYITNLTAD